MRKFRTFCLVLCIIGAIFQIYTIPAAAQSVDNGQPESVQQDNPAVHSGCHSTDALNAFLGTGKLVENVQAAFLYETTSQTLMYAQNPDTPVSPSSLVKILTAYIAVEQGNLEQTVTVTQSALSTVPYDAAVADLVSGETVTLGDLICCMMVGSANDAAAVIAEHISGSQDAFVKEMNAYAQRLGCTATQFKNAHGLHDDEQYSTVRDLTKILCAALENDDFRTIFSTTHYTVPETNKSAARELSSGNFLMNTDNMQIYYDQRVTGGRTGIADDGSRCLAACAQSGSMELVSVITGAESVLDEDGHTVKVFGSFKETTALLDAGFNGYSAVQVLFPEQPLLQRSVLNGVHDVILGTKTAAYTVLPSETTSGDLSFRYTNVVDEIKAPLAQGQHLSTVQIWYGNLCVAQAELYSMNSVPEAVVEQEPDDADTDKNGISKVIIVTLIIIAVAVFGMLVIRFIAVFRKTAKRKQANRYRRDRRRSH